MKQFFTLWLGLLAMPLFAQQDPIFSQYLFNGLALNPAYAGSRGALSGVAFYRSQWQSIEGAPVTQNLSLHSPLRNEKYALGMNIVSDKIGVTQQTSLFASYAYRILLGKRVFAMGIQAGFEQYSANYSTVATAIANDPAFVGQDVRLLLPNFGVGFYYSSEKGFAGLSVPHLINQSLGTGDQKSQSQLVRHVFLTGGYLFDLSAEVQTKPSALLKVSQGAPIQFDLSDSFIYKETVLLGASLRNLDAVSAMFQVRFKKKFWFGYAYDLPINGLRSHTGGTHELMIGFDHPFQRKVILSPRYF